MPFKYISKTTSARPNASIPSAPVFSCTAPAVSTAVRNIMPPLFTLTRATTGNYSSSSSYDSYSGGTTSACQNALAIARRELNKGVHETAKNDSIDIRRYKNGERNNQPWCASFASYLYPNGPFGYTTSSQEIKRRAGKKYYAYKNSGYTPKPGDLAIWTYSKNTGHVGIVEKVYPDGSFDVIEGNSGNSIKRNHYSSQSAAGRGFNGFVKMNEWTANS